MGDCAWFYLLNSFDFPSKTSLTDDASCRPGKFNVSSGRNWLNYGCTSVEWGYFSMGQGKRNLRKGLSFMIFSHGGCGEKQSPSVPRVNRWQPASGSLSACGYSHTGARCVPVQ